MRNSNSLSQQLRLQTSRRTLDEIDIIEDSNNNINERSNEQDSEVLFGREGRDMSVTVIGALLWPSISSIVGRY